MDARFRIEACGKGDSLERKIAVVDDIVVAGATFDAAVARWPDKWPYLAAGSRVIRENKPG